MSACKSHQRQIALLAMQALNESESDAVSEHLRECDECRQYAKQLEGIVGLYVQDAERPVAPRSAPAPRFEVRPMPWFKWLFVSPRPAAAALAAIALFAALLLIRSGPERDVPQPTQVAGTIAPITVPSIGSSRHLAAAELEDLTQLEPARKSARTEFVFSVKTRDDTGY